MTYNLANFYFLLYLLNILAKAVLNIYQETKQIPLVMCWEKVVKTNIAWSNMNITQPSNP